VFFWKVERSRSFTLPTSSTNFHRLLVSVLRSAESSSSDEIELFNNISAQRNSTKDDRRQQAPSTPRAVAVDEINNNGLPSVKRIPSLLKRTTSSSSLSSSSERRSKESIQKTQDNERRKMNLLWCQSDRCVDVVRERVVGSHNNIILNGPATGQVAYRWNKKVYSEVPTLATNDDDKKSHNTLSSILLLVKPGDEALLRIAAENVPKLTETGINILLAPDLAAKLKHYYGVDDPRISLFEPPKDPNEAKWNIRYMDDPEEDWIEDMKYVEPFPDLVCTVGGDGLLMYASMLFQGPVPPLLAISGGSLGFLTPFAEHEMVEAVKTALGIISPSNGNDDDFLSMETDQDELQVFPPNMPSYPYEPLMKSPHTADATPKFSFGLGDFICMTIRMRLDCRVVNREGVVRARYNVLNEVVIDRGSSPYLAALECFCDDVHLTTVQADGVIFATPTGSTAYSMAAGGSVVHPAVPCILVTPICPHVLSFRSMVFPDHVVLRCFVPEDARSTAAVAFDGKHRCELQRGDSVQIQMSAYPVPTINRGDHSSDWLESLKRSFNFNTRPRQRPL
jgi:NAD+ kinase